MAELGQLIRQHRYSRGWTQEELARKIGGTNQTAISLWENGRETWGSLHRFDDLVRIFDYPEDMIAWWVDRQFDEIDKINTKVTLFKERTSSRVRPKVLARLDGLIEQNERMQAELMALREHLEEMTALAKG